MSPLLVDRSKSYPTSLANIKNNVYITHDMGFYLSKQFKKVSWQNNQYELKEQKKDKNMSIVWGVLIIAAGLLILIGGILKSDFIIYRLLVARSKILWGENVHRFYQLVGLMVIIFGILVTIGII